MPSVHPPDTRRSTTSSSGTRSPRAAWCSSAAPSCGVVRHPPAPLCGECHSTEWDTQESSGHGHVYTWIVSHHPTKPDAEPRIVVLVELDEGIRFVSNLLGVDATDVQNGMEVDAQHRGRRRRACSRSSGRPLDGLVTGALADDTAIVGIGQTEFSKHSGRSELQLAGEAVAPRSPTPGSRPPTSTAR